MRNWDGFYRRAVLGGAFILLVLLLYFLVGKEYLTLERLKEKSDFLRNLVQEYYLLSALGFMSLLICTAFFLPGTIVLTIAGGFLFGILQGTFFTLTGATGGALLSFLTARYLVGNWVQRKYEENLKNFNREIQRNGDLYLLTLRIVPVLPFFAVNYLAGFTEMPLKTFGWTTFLGIIPGTAVYSFVGEQLRMIRSIQDVYSGKLIAAYITLGIFTLLPVVLRHVRRKRS